MTTAPAQPRRGSDYVTVRESFRRMPDGSISALRQIGNGRWEPFDCPVAPLAPTEYAQEVSHVHGLECEARASVMDTKYSRGSGPAITVGEIVDKLLAARDVNAFCDVMDDEFLFGAWGDYLRDVPSSLLRDIRGLAWALVARQKKP
jgi:hypothetical protein